MLFGGMLGCSSDELRGLGQAGQAVLGLRWFRQNTDITALARDHGISRATGYRYLDEVVTVLAEQAPDLHDALRQAKDDGLSHVVLDGKLFSADRLNEKTTSVKGKQIDLWYSGKTHGHGGNVQALRHRMASRCGSAVSSRARCTT